VPGTSSLDLDSTFRALREVGYAGSANVVWHGSRGWDLPQTTATLRAAARFLGRYVC